MGSMGGKRTSDIDGGEMCCVDQLTRQFSLALDNNLNRVLIH
jgi:hypothetical protein